MNILKDKGKYYFYNTLTIENELKPKNYLFNFDEFGNCWLEDTEEFKLPVQVYDVNKELRDLVKLSFDAYNRNLGVLLTGNKGQGKSLTAKLVCKNMNLPVVILSKPIPSAINFVSFLNNIKQDYILFVDEFEKLFITDSHGNGEKAPNHTQESFLSFMDGVLTTENKVIFLLTTNETVNEYLINRPSRIKFLQEYSELPEDLFNMIVDDRLKNKEFKQDLEENISLININIDLLISIVEDINLFNRPFSEFSNLYNYKFEQYRYEVFTTIEGQQEKFQHFHQTDKKIKYTSTYVANHHVENMLKFSKDEIIFQTHTWIEAQNDKEEDRKVLMQVKLVPFKNFTKVTF